MYMQVSSGTKVDTKNNKGMKSIPTFSANKRKREPVGVGDINDKEEKKLIGDDNNVESEAGTKEVEMKDAETVVIDEGGIKEVEMQDATEVHEKTINKEDDESKLNKDDHIRSNLNTTEVCKQNQTTEKSECIENQISVGASGQQANKDDCTRSDQNATEACKQNQTTEFDKSECNEKQINVGASGQRALGEIATLLKQVQETSDEKAKLEVDIKVIKKTDRNGDTKENGNDNQTVARVSCP
ncbi:hypothetical protein L6452_07595 [Arctium lappa]|uniref:Uncharacterized protein n=1 Tax=Arctium lappa TaxID=4217 RepID=A0ACB9ELB2_ARCLA|nr:hypothetical protein L6452_07595 [Arctium lappa]